MSTKQTQGKLWSTAPTYWSTHFEPFFLPRAHHRFVRSVPFARIISLRPQVCHDEFHPANRKRLIDRPARPRKHQRVMRHMGIKSSHRSGMRRRAPIAVVPSEIVIVPNICDRHISVQVRLLRRSQDRVVRRRKNRRIVCVNILIMKIPHVQEH